MSGSPFEQANLPRASDPHLLGAAAAERLLAGQDAAPGAPRVERALADVLAAARGPVSRAELAQEAAYVAAFVMVTSPAGASPGLPTPRPRRLAPLALAAVLAMLALGGTAMAGVLPAGLQELVHVTLDAPAPRLDRPQPRSAVSAPAQDGKRDPGPSGKQGAQGLPPGLAKKPGGLPPGQARKQQDTQPGQARKQDGTPPGRARRPQPATSRPHRHPIRPGTLIPGTSTAASTVRTCPGCARQWPHTGHLAPAVLPTRPGGAPPACGGAASWRGDRPSNGEPVADRL